MAQRVAKSRASMDLKLSVLSALNKLADRDTQQIAVDELLKIAENLQPEGIPVYLGCLYDISPDQKSMVRREGMKLLSLMASLYDEMLTPHLPKIVSAIVRRLRETDSNIRDACVETIGTLVAHVPAPASLANGNSGNADQVALSGPLGVYTKPLFDALNEQARNVQIGAAMCITRAMDNAQELPSACIQRLCLKLLKFLSAPNFNAKAALLPAFGGLSRASGVGIYQHLPLIVPCVQDALQSSDWATRKAAADTFASVALSVGGPPLTCFKTSTMALLEQYRFDKVKPARDSVVDAIHIWKNVPDPPEDASPPRAVSSKSSNSNGSVINRKLLGGSESRSSTPTTTPVAEKSISSRTPLDKGSVKKKAASATSASERKTNLDFFRKLSTRNSDDWHIEVAVPRGSPPASHNKENREETTVVPPMEKVVSSKVAVVGNGAVHSPSGNEDREVVARRQEILADKLESSEKNRVKEEVSRINARNGGKDTNGSQWSHSTQTQTQTQHQHPHMESAVDSAPLMNGSCDIQRKSVTSPELVTIGRQLSQLGRGQSNLMEMLQEFMGNSQESTLNIESRVQRLERAMEDIARLTAVSLGTSKPAASDSSYSGGAEYGYVADSGIRKPVGEANGNCHSAVRGYSSREAEAWNSDILRGMHKTSQHFERENKDESHPWEQQQQQQRALVSGLQARLGEGPSARSVWRASKDEASTLAAIRVAGAENHQPTMEPADQHHKKPSSVVSLEASIESSKEQANGAAAVGAAGSWSVWTRVMESLQSGDLDAAYEEVICTGDELLLVRLMNRTGPVLGQLSNDTVGELVHAVAVFMQQPSFVDCALPWIRQITDMVRSSGPRCLGLSTDIKRELISALHEASTLDFSERWMGSAVSKMATQLGSAWLH